MKTKKRRTKVSKIKRGRRRQQVFNTLLVPFVAFLTIWIILFIYAKMHDGGKTIAPGVEVDGVDLSGQTETEAVGTLRSHLASVGKTPVSFVVGGITTELTLNDLGVGYKDATAQELASEAFRYGKKGGALKRFFSLRKARKKGKDFDVLYAVDDTKAVAKLEEDLPAFSGAAVNASIEHTADGFRITEGKEGVVLDEKATIDLLNESLNTDWDGNELVIEAASKVDMPKITAEMLSPITDKMGSYTTDYGGGDARSINIECATSHLNGLIVLPGEEISVNAQMEPYTEENGYVAAGSYENGKVVDTMGGGICQVSTTLYNALIYSELEITERYPHSLTVSYIDPSRDAAIADDVKDLKFRNNTDAPILIEGSVSGGYVTFTVYGHDTRDPNRRVEFETETYNVEVAETIYKGTADPVGYMMTTNFGHNGMNATLWKIVYQNGQEVSREEFNTSVYRKTDTTIDVGTVLSNGTMSSNVMRAINTQDLNKINAAIYAGY